MRKCKGLPKIPFLKKTFGPSMHEEEGKDFHASGYGLSCDAFANKGAILLDGTIVQDTLQGHETYTDPLVNPFGADTVIPFHQSLAKVILYGGTTRDGFFFDGKFRGENRRSYQKSSLASEVWRWDPCHMYPEYGMSEPIRDERIRRREFDKKCYVDPRGAVLQFRKQSALLIRRMKLFRQAEEQVARAQRDGVLRLLPDEKDVRDVLKKKKKKSYIKTWRNKFRTVKQACNPAWAEEQRYL